MLYSGAAALIPARQYDTEATQIIHDFATIQKCVACMISGQYWTPAAEVVNLEIYPLPIRH